MEPTSPFVVYAPLVLAIVSALGFAVTVGILIFSRVFRLGKFFAEFTALRETVADLQGTVADNKTELQQEISDTKTDLQQAIAHNKSEIEELRQEMRDGFSRIENKIDAGLQELRGYFVAHLEHHSAFSDDDDQVKSAGSSLGRQYGFA